MGSVKNLAFPDKRAMMSGHAPLSFPALEVAMMSGAVASIWDQGAQTQWIARVTSGI